VEERCQATGSDPSVGHSSRRRPALNLPPPKNDTGALQVNLDEPEPELEANTTTSSVEASGADLKSKYDHQETEVPSDNFKARTPTATDPRIPGRSTNFLALDKCLPRRQFLEIVEIETTADIGNKQLRIEYDPEWLAILRLCNEHMPLDESPFCPPAQATMSGSAPLIPLFPEELLNRELSWVSENVFSEGSVAVPLNFAPIAPAPPPETSDHAVAEAAAVVIMVVDMTEAEVGPVVGNLAVKDLTHLGQVHAQTSSIPTRRQRYSAK
ncbi:lariat debranching enzyme, partial [Coemansia guatemalensis]